MIQNKAVITFNSDIFPIINWKFNLSQIVIERNCYENILCILQKHGVEQAAPHAQVNPSKPLGSDLKPAPTRNDIVSETESVTSSVFYKPMSSPVPSPDAAQYDP